MKTLAVVLLIILLGVSQAIADGTKPETTQQLVTTWGATSTETTLPWTYQTAPNPPFQGTPDHWLVGFSFPKSSTALTPEAKGSMKSTAEDLTAGGDVSDLADVRLLVLGFADGVAEKANAEKLGLARAEKAREVLVKLGFRKENIQVASYGARYSTATPQEPLRQQYDREVAVWVLR